MDNLFYFSITLIGTGLLALAFYSVYRFGKKRGAREYYNILTTNNQEDEIQ